MVIGISAIFASRSLSGNPVFFYLCGIIVGVSASFMLLVYYVSKLLPKVSDYLSNHQFIRTPHTYVSYIADYVIHNTITFSENLNIWYINWRLDGRCIHIPTDVGKHPQYCYNISSIFILVHFTGGIHQFCGLLQDWPTKESEKQESCHVDITSMYSFKILLQVIILII